ncbi:MAG: HNH endonuclease [Solirubrobacterales bacterium]
MTLFVRDTTAETREPLTVPPLRKPNDWLAWQGVTLSVQLVARPPKPANEIERAYALGLTALASDEPENAFDQLRVAVEQDAQWAYSSAKLLVLVIYRTLGDASPLSALVDACMADDKPDSFATRAVADCTLRVSRHEDDDEGMQLDHMLLFPALATQLANAGPLLLGDDFGAGCIPLATARDLAETPWAPRFTDGFSYQAENARRSLIEELSSNLCLRYIFSGQPDAALDLLNRSRFVGDVYRKAEALADKGLTDAALVAYDDAIKVGKKGGMYYQFHARYNKAKLLISLGQLTRARKELARLYADQPTYSDEEGLLDAIKPSRRTTSRAAIPEEVRHAVWRRDQGRCARCDSQESLEFDHIIPVSRGGANTERNLQLLCERCNREKSATI